MRSMLWKSTFREIKQSLGRFLAIFAIVALGVGFFAGLKVTKASMVKTTQKYLEQMQLYDYRILTTLGLDEEEVGLLRSMDGVRYAEGAYTYDILCTVGGSSEVVLRAHSLLEKINGVKLVAGRMPQEADECVVDSNSYGASQIGQMVRLSQDNEEADKEAFAYEEYKIVGVVQSSYYIQFERGNTSLGNGRVTSFLYLLPEGFDSDYYTEAYVKFDRDFDLYSEEYDAFLEEKEPAFEELLDQIALGRYGKVQELYQGKLEDARKELADAEEDGKRELEDAWRELEEGKLQILNGEQELTDGRKELADGRATLEEKQKELNDGEEEIEEEEQRIRDGEDELERNIAEWNEKNEELQEAIGELEARQAQLDAQKAPLQTQQMLLAASQSQLSSQAQSLDQQERLLDIRELGLDGQEESLDGQEAQEDARTQAYQSQLQALEDWEQSLKDQNGGTVPEPYASIITGSRAALEQIMASSGQTEEDVQASREEIRLSREQIAKEREALSQERKKLSDNKAQLEDGMKQLTDGLATIASYQKQIDDGRKQLDDASAALTEGWAQIEEAQKTLTDGKIQIGRAKADLLEGKGQLADGRKELEEAQIEIDEGERELADAKLEYAKGLQEYRDGLEEFQNEIADAEKRIADSEEELSTMEQADGYLLDRFTNIGYACFESDSGIVDGIANIFPLFFFAVAALVCITTMNRMVEEQRTQIGVLKALGYGEGRIMGKYLFYSGSAAVLGCLIGFFGGTWLFPRVIWTAYGLMYRVDTLLYVFDWKLALISLAVSCACSIGTTWLSCRYELSEVAAELMRPKAPKAGKRVLLERVGFIWNRMKFLYKVSYRNIFRYKKRFFMMVIGISGCTALLVTGFGIKDSIANVAYDQFHRIQVYDIGVTFQDPVDELEEKKLVEALGGRGDGYTVVLEKSVDLYASDRVKSINLLAMDGTIDPSPFLDLHTADGEPLGLPGDGECILNQKLARDYHIEVGDSIELKEEGKESVSLKVAGINENFIYNYVYMTISTYEDLMGEPAECKTAYVNLAPEADVHLLSASLMRLDGVANVTVNADTEERFSNMMRSLDLIVLVVILCAAGLAFIVLYNLTNINITERVREIATIKVLGFYPNETSAYVFRENVALTLVGALAGLVLGHFLHRFVMSQINVDMVSFQVHVKASSFAISLVLTFVFSWIVNKVMEKKLDAVSMTESLKSVD